MKILRWNGVFFTYAEIKTLQLYNFVKFDEIKNFVQDSLSLNQQKYAIKTRVNFWP